MILAGDVGGTKTLLVLYRMEGDELIVEREQQYRSGDFQSLEAIIQQFMLGHEPVFAAGFGVAGPVVDGVSRTTNLPWVIEASVLSRRLGDIPVVLINDLQAAALGILALSPDDMIELNPNAEPRVGTASVIAAGTGLGEALLYFDGVLHHPIPTEGGHCDFAPNSPLEDDLLRFLRDRFGGHVSYERILSGDGFRHLYDFLKDAGHAIERDEVRHALETESDPNTVITRYGVSGDDPLCVKTVQLFARIYGAEAGNLALKSLSVGGVYVSGAIAGHILPVLKAGTFMDGFLDKGRFAELLSKIPVRVVTNPKVPLIGAALAAKRKLGAH
ncbi:MAG TPA: glucokinase [Halothiobacillus sp.]|nr:glucokinase [Halothiobacillus sp.]